MSKVKTVYLDMDGVVYDFYKAYARLRGYEYSFTWFYATHDAREELDEYFLNITKEKENYGLFSQLDCYIDGSFELIDRIIELKNEFGFELKVLTAVPEMVNVEMLEEFSKQKRHFMYSVFSDKIEHFSDVCISNGRIDKRRFMKDGCVLIDDHLHTHLEFKELGYGSVYHKNVNQTIQDLMDYLVA